MDATDREGEPTLAALLGALRNHAVATGRDRLAHLCSAGLYAGDFAAVARVVAAIDGIDTSPTMMPDDGSEDDGSDADASPAVDPIDLSGADPRQEDGVFEVAR